MDDSKRIAIIGAGLAGLTAARELSRAGLRVTVFEKSRGRGGRMATRRADGRQFDHGAQYFTARTPAFQAAVARWVDAGAAARWRGRFVELPEAAPNAGARAARDPAAVERFVGVPGMSRIGGLLAAELELHLQTRVAQVRREDGRWSIETAEGACESAFDVVLVATPAEQALPLLAAAPALAARVAAVRTRPCWAVLLGLDAPLDVSFDAARIREGALGWVARDTSKPGRGDGAGETWVLHASPEWSAAHLDLAGSEVASQLVAAFEQVTEVALPTPPAFTAAHLWRYARTSEPLGEPCLWDAALRIGACGDWCVGERVEAAFESGRALATRVLDG